MVSCPNKGKRPACGPYARPLPRPPWARLTAAGRDLVGRFLELYPRPAVLLWKSYRRLWRDAERLAGEDDVHSAALEGVVRAVRIYDPARGGGGPGRDGLPPGLLALAGCCVRSAVYELVRETKRHAAETTMTDLYRPGGDGGWDWPEPAAPAGADPAAALDAAADVWDLLRRAGLTGRQAAAVGGRVWLGESFAAVGGRMGLTKEMARQHYEAALARFRGAAGGAG